jgi:hypothetical protein
MLDAYGTFVDECDKLDEFFELYMTLFLLLRVYLIDLFV